MQAERAPKVTLCALIKYYMVLYTMEAKMDMPDYFWFISSLFVGT